MITIIVVISLLCSVYSIPIDNGVEGDPEIECGPTSITANINTQNNFEGHVYVKGRYAEPDCRNDEVGRKVAGISLPFTSCGVKRERSANPKGIFVSVTIVITFHPLFLTKIDRAYKIQCFYMEADKTVSTDIEVSMITTGFETQVVPMPVCRYEILEGGPSGPVIKYALIGQQVYHKWTCDTETVDTFCMLVHACFVDDGQGDRVDLIDTEGCGLDKNLLGNLEYPTDLMAGQEAHVFKYADRANLYFNCQISISVKEPFGQCPLPNCPEPPGSRGKRSADDKLKSIHSYKEPSLAVVDVATEDIQVLDISEDQNPVLPKDVRRRGHFVIGRTEVSADGLCMSPLGFGVLMSLTVTVFVVAIAFVSYTCFSRKS